MTAKELFESGSVLVRDYKGHEQMLMNEGTFIAIVDELLQLQIKNKNILVDVPSDCVHDWCNSGVTLQGKSLLVCLRCGETKQANL